MEEKKKLPLALELLFWFSGLGFVGLIIRGLIALIKKGN
jgi:hypothetical protein